VPALRDSIDDHGKGERLMDIEDIMLTMPACPKCGNVFVPCDCGSDPARVDKVDRFRRAMAEELKKAGYTVTPPRPEKFRAIPPIDLHTSK
jgi:uncharacterized OB-fold protein